MSSAKKNTLCLKEKMNLIDSYENQKLSVKELQEKYKCGKTQIYYIIKRRSEIKEMWRKGTRADLMKKRRCDNEEVNNLVWEWFVDAKSQNLPVSGPLIQSQAKIIAEKLGNYTFKASNGWLESFRKRNNIVGSEVRDELKGINQECIDEWKKKIPNIIQDYKAEDIFSGAETGLFFRELPSKTVIIKEEKYDDVKQNKDLPNEAVTINEEIDICNSGQQNKELLSQTVIVKRGKYDGGKQNKERLTIFLCCSLKGEKEKPLIIGKTAKPRCFENLCLTKLPVLWKSSKNTLMTSEILKEWLEYFDRNMQTQQRNVLLFLNNAITFNIDLKNVKLIFLPKSTVHQTQPLYQGIIENLKTYYRKFCIQSVHTRMTTYESVNEMSRSITILDAILWISSSWNNIKETVIESCFKKAGFPSNNTDNCGIIDDDIRTIKQFILETFPDTCDADQYVGIDRNISPTESLECFVEPMNHNQQSDDSDHDEQVEDTSLVDEKDKIKTYPEALKAINQIRDFSLFLNDGPLFDLMNNAKNHVENIISCGIIEKQRKSTEL